MRQETLMKGTTALEESIIKMEKHNDVLQQTITTYEARLTEAEHQLNATLSQNERYQSHIECMKSELNEKDKQINDLKIQIEKHKTKTSPAKSSINTNAAINNNNSISRNNSPRPRLPPPNQSPRNGESIRLNDIMKKLNAELQHVRKKAGEDASRFVAETTELQLQVGSLKSRISGLEITVDKKEIEVSRLNSLLDDAKRKEADLREELYLKSSRYSPSSTDHQKELQRREHKLGLDLQIAKKTIEEQSESLIKNQDNNKLLLSENEQLIRTIEVLNNEVYFICSL